MSDTLENEAEPKVKRSRKPKANADTAPKVKKPRVVSVKEEKIPCAFCKKKITAAEGVKHLCIQKKRWLDRDLPYVRIAFEVFSLFFKINFRRDVNFDDFIQNSNHKFFVTFGKYIYDVNAVQPMGFARFVIEKGAGLPIHKWPQDSVYETYVRQLTARESPDAAAERTILLMEQWAVESGEDWRDFFRLISPTLAVHWIRSGRLSPWLLYATQSGNDLLGRFSEEQLKLVEQYIDPALWKRRISMNRDAIQSLQAVLKEAGL